VGIEHTSWIGFGLVWYGLTLVWFGLVWFGLFLFCLFWFGSVLVTDSSICTYFELRVALRVVRPLSDLGIRMVWFGLIWFGLVWYGMVWFGLVWFGLVWFGLVWFGLGWFGLLIIVVIRFGIFYLEYCI
jgi:hypothetical protein